MSHTLVESSQDIDPAMAYLSIRQRYWLLAVACMDVSIVVASMVALNAALPDIARQTTATQAQLTWVIDGYTLVLACLLLPAGAIGDRYGRRGALLAGLAVFILASAAPMVFDDPAQLIAARAVAGAGAAFIMPATLSLLTAAFPKSERNKAIGIWAGVVGSGAVFGFLITGGLLHFWGWQSIFATFALAGTGLFILTCTVPSSRDEDAASLDWIGAVLIGSAVAVFVLGVVEAPVRGWMHPLVWGCMGGGIALAAAFAVVELKRPHPLLDIRLFRQPDFATGAVGITFLFFANFGYFFVSMQYIQLVMGYSPIQTAIALCPLMLPVLALSATTHWYLPRLGLRVCVSAGLLLIAAGLMCMRLLELDSGYLDYAWPLMIISTGIGMCTAPTTSAIMGAVPDENQGVASAVNDTTREVGAALGIAVAGSILAANYQNHLGPKLTGLPAEVREPLLSSLAEALAVAPRLGPQGTAVADLAKQAFLDATNSAVLVMAVVLAVAAAFVGIWAPGRDGEQLRVVRRIRSRGTQQPGDRSWQWSRAGRGW
ncbi:MFS transporter [Mycolicibacterium boenickei]|uniref:MFS transporter n=1 Tax=Mycolicibacterium boenickei TaxID=146017 RepID=A0AAX2ZU37_9MYCO|nr:MFS transporter [Mycolicibacterium boenickei]PEG62298.1 MFS transporter [Mycolicibacterium boenickei]UNB98721.1 MFS transporter [Mycolicibacterium boenickei]BBX94579.1 MFS transporter [Mycolicibacterium boenickei]